MKDNKSYSADKNNLIELLDFPFNSSLLLQKKIKILKQLEATVQPKLKKKIAILGGSTPDEVINILELFLLKMGIAPVFYSCAYNKYYEEVMFDQDALRAFEPDVIYFHTTIKNITDFPNINDTQEQIQEKKQAVISHYTSLWETAHQIFQCPIIQNNFELPNHRSLGNLDCSNICGKSHFVMQLNNDIGQYVTQHDFIHINDIFYLSSRLGLDTWYDDRFWYAYKYAISYQAIPHLSYGISQLIGAIFGFSKKCLVLDLDNTLWGGVIGEAGINGIELGTDTPLGEAYSSFQRYIKELSDRGIILAVNSKNEEDNAFSGFEHPDSILRKNNFTSFKANWAPKPNNIIEIAKEINISLDSLVFIDDNPAERDFVKSQLDEVIVPNVGNDPCNFMRILDDSLLFESINISNADINRNQQYAENHIRQQNQAQFSNYDEFLKSLEMQAEIKTFSPLYTNRITQLINKSNQFNVTTIRRTESEVQAISKDKNYLCLYGRLKDKFGDNGLISVLIGEYKANELHIDTWLMSCRVFKRGMEVAMFNTLVEQAKTQKIKKIIGYYQPTEKNKLIANLFQQFQFSLIKTTSENETVWQLNLEPIPKLLTHTITINH